MLPYPFGVFCSQEVKTPSTFKVAVMGESHSWDVLLRLSTFHMLLDLRTRLSSPPPLPRPLFSMCPPCHVGAAGGIGQPLSMLMRMSPLVSELSLYDVAPIVKGVACDLSHCDLGGGKASVPVKWARSLFFSALSLFCMCFLAPILEARQCTHNSTQQKVSKPRRV